MKFKIIIILSQVLYVFAELYDLNIDSQHIESTIRKPGADLELTAEEENLLNTGICKIVFNEADSYITNAVFKRNEISLNKIEKSMYLFILSESVKDYAMDLKKISKEKGVWDKFNKDEQENIESALRVHCDLSELRDIYEKLIALPFSEKYKDTLTNATYWETYVAIQLDRVYDYVNTHFNMFKKELLRLKNTKAYYERKNFFRGKQGKAMLIHIFYEWLENTVCKPRRIDEAEIRNKLNAHLKWVVSLPSD